MSVLGSSKSILTGEQQHNFYSPIRILSPQPGMRWLRALLQRMASCSTSVLRTKDRSLMAVISEGVWSMRRDLMTFTSSPIYWLHQGRISLYTLKFYTVCIIIHSIPSLGWQWCQVWVSKLGRHLWTLQAPCQPQPTVAPLLRPPPQSWKEG